MGQVKEEKFCYLQGQERANGSFLFITPSRARFVLLCQYMGLLVCWLRETGEKTARGAIIKGVDE